MHSLLKLFPYVMDRRSPMHHGLALLTVRCVHPILLYMLLLSRPLLATPPILAQSFILIRDRWSGRVRDSMPGWVRVTLFACYLIIAVGTFVYATEADNIRALTPPDCSMLWDLSSMLDGTQSRHHYRGRHG